MIGHADRAEPSRDDRLGLLLPGERKGVEPIAARTAPARISAQHQSLLHFVANAPWSGRSAGPRSPRLMRRDTEHHPVGVKALALGLPAARWQTISRREGTTGAPTSRFPRVRVRAAHRDEWRAEPRDEERPLIEGAEGEAEPAKYRLAIVPPDTPV